MIGQMCFSEERDLGATMLWFSVLGSMKLVMLYGPQYESNVKDFYRTIQQTLKLLSQKKISSCCLGH